MGPVKITRAHPSLRKQVFNVKKSVKEIQNKEELKYLDTFLNGTTIGTTATLTLLNGMVLGDDVSNRTGDDISPTSIQFRCTIAQAPTQVAFGTIWRHMILWDSQANGAIMSAGDILDQGVITPGIIAPYKRQYQKRFKIVYDKTISLNPGTVDPANATTEIVQPITHKKFKKALGRVVKYRNAQNSGTITDIASNSLYSYWVASVASAGTVTCGYRMYFKDD